MTYTYSTSRAAIVEVDEVSTTFAHEVRALDGLSLSVRAGTVHALLGPNGAGKTTLVRILSTLLVPDSGRVRVAGVDVRDDAATVRTLIGLAGQYAAVDDHLTGRENVEMIGRLYGLTAAESRDRTTDLLDRIALTVAADRRVSTYSGGMRRRLDLAASLIGRPRVLLLDEPTTGLDPGSRRDLWDLVRLLVREGTTVLLTTQYLDEADHLADHISVIDSGRVISEGTPADLKATAGAATVELVVEPVDRDRLVAALQGLEPRVDDHDGDTVRVPATEGTATLRQVLGRLDAADLEVTDLALRRPTLDDVFLSLTGHHAANTRRAA